MGEMPFKKPSKPQHKIEEHPQDIILRKIQRDAEEASITETEEEREEAMKLYHSKNLSSLSIDRLKRLLLQRDSDLMTAMAHGDPYGMGIYENDAYHNLKSELAKKSSDLKPEIE